MAHNHWPVGPEPQSSVAYNFCVLQLVSERWKGLPHSIKGVGARPPLW